MDRFRFGRLIRLLRQRRGWRQVDLADQVGSSRSVISRVELGEIERIACADPVAISDRLGARLELDLRWRGGEIDRLADEAHAATVDVIVGLLRRLGWETDVEVSFSIYGERGSIDVGGRERQPDSVTGRPRPDGGRPRATRRPQPMPSPGRARAGR